MSYNSGRTFYPITIVFGGGIRLTDTEYLKVVLSLFQTKYHKHIKSLAYNLGELDTDIILYVLYKYNLLPYILSVNLNDNNFSHITDDGAFIDTSKNINVSVECKDFVKTLQTFCKMSFKGTNKNDAYGYFIAYIFLYNTKLKAYNTLHHIFKDKQLSDILTKVTSYVYTMFNIPDNSTFTQYGRFLTVPPVNSSKNKCIGRDKELSNIIDILSRKDKNNVLLVGNAGVGKTAVVEGLACLLLSDKCPNKFKGYNIYELSLSALISGATYRGDFEGRLTELLKLIQTHNNIILFIDEIHNIMGNSKDDSGSGINASEILKPFMCRDNLYVIGATTLQENKLIQSDKAISRRFSTVNIDEPSTDIVCQMLLDNIELYENYFDITIPTEIVQKIVQYGDKYITNKYFPDKAFELLDNACVNCINHSKQMELSLQDVHKSAELMCNIKIPQFTNVDTWNPTTLQCSLNKKIVGQVNVIREVVKSLTPYYIGLHSTDKPIASFLFVGSTGVGKTQLCKELSTHLFTSETFLKLDMSEYSESHSIAKLIGSPPGYVGYSKGGILTEFVKNHSHSVILFDEIEKAHCSINNILLQIMDEGRLTDNSGDTVNFCNCIIILTSNIGAKDIVDSNNTVGFNTQKNVAQDKHIYSKAVKKYFSPELLGRLQVVYFNSLQQQDIKEIIDIHLESIINKFKNISIVLTITNKVKNFLYTKYTSCEYGVREIKNILTTNIESVIVDYILNSELSTPCNITLDMDNDKVICLKDNGGN